MKKLKSLLFNSEMTELARQAEKKPKTIVQLLIFVLVFIIATSIGSIFIGISTIFVKDELISAVSTAMSAANTSSAGLTEKMSAMVGALGNAAMSIPLIHVMMLFVTAITTVVVIIFCTKIEKRPAASLGLTTKNFGKHYGIGLLVGFVMLTAVTLCNVAFGTMNITFNTGVVKALPLMLLYLIGYFLQGMSEEIVCRGYLQMTMSIHHNQIFAVIVSALVFAIMHGSNNGIDVYAFINLLLYGVLMSLMLLRTNDIWMVSALHTAWNFSQGHLFGISVSGSTASTDTLFITTPVEGASEFINGGSFGVEGGVTTTIVILIVIVCIVLSVKDNGETIKVNE